MNKYAKPCPFCGESIGVIEEERGDEYSYWLVIHQPHKTGQHHGRIIMPVEWWNTRPIEDALLTRAEKAEEMVEWLIEAVDGYFFGVEHPASIWRKKISDLVTEWKEREENGK